MTDMDSYLKSAEMQAYELGLSKVFRQSFAQISSHLAASAQDPADVPDDIWAQLDEMRRLVLKGRPVAQKRDGTGEVAQEDTRGATEAEIWAKLRRDCQATLDYWDEPWGHSLVMDNLTSLYLHRYPTAKSP